MPNTFKADDLVTKREWEEENLRKPQYSLPHFRYNRPGLTEEEEDNPLSIMMRRAKSQNKNS